MPGITYKTVDLDKIYPVDSAKIATAITASGAIPPLFRPVNYEGTNMIDGGIAVFIDIEAAIERCLETVGDQSKIILDAVMLGGDGLDVIEGKAMPEGLGFRDIDMAMKKYPHV